MAYHKPHSGRPHSSSRDYDDSELVPGCEQRFDHFRRPSRRRQDVIADRQLVKRTKGDAEDIPQPHSFVPLLCHVLCAAPAFP